MENNKHMVAFVDDLTGLKNRNGLLEDYGNQDLNQQHFIFVDIDDFKNMNAIFGIDSVDRLLVLLSKSLLDYCGKSNVYRINAGQFVLVTESHFICEPKELQRILKQPFDLDNLQIVVRASICVLDHDDFPEASLQDVLKVMMLTLDVEKRKQKNILVYANKKTMEQYTQKRDIALSLYEAVKNKRFYPKFIPFMDTFTHEIIGFETVSRWNLNGQMLRPYSFLEAAEWTGLIYDIELQMFEEGARFFDELKSNKEIAKNKSVNCVKRFKVAFHFSAYTLKMVEIKDLQDILRKYDIKENDIIIETKEKFITDDQTIDKLQELHNTGFMVALDDYSNDSSSVTYLADLNVDIIKLSEDLLEHIDTDQEFMRVKSVYKFLVDLTKKFDITVVSDGINNAKNAKLVRDLDVHIGLGKYYTRAIVKDEFIQFVLKNKRKR